MEEDLHLIVNTITATAARQLLDEINTTYEESVLIDYLNLAIVEIITAKPDAYVETRVQSLLPGTRQALDADVIRLVDVVANMGVSGTSRGQAITAIPKMQIDILLPNWATYATSATVSYAVLDDRTPKLWYCFPPQPAMTANYVNGGSASNAPVNILNGGDADTAPADVLFGGSAEGTGLNQVEINVSAPPTRLTSINETFPLDDSYYPSCVDYIVARCLMEETTVPNALQKGSMYMQKFQQNLGMKTGMEQANNQQGR